MARIYFHSQQHQLQTRTVDTNYISTSWCTRGVIQRVSWFPLEQSSEERSRSATGTPHFVQDSSSEMRNRLRTLKETP